jgi:virulence-associated protein VapD
MQYASVLAFNGEKQQFAWFNCCVFCVRSYALEKSKKKKKKKREKKP